MLAERKVDLILTALIRGMKMIVSLLEKVKAGQEI